MEKLKEKGIELVSHKNNNITTDDRFTKGNVILSIKHKDMVYDFTLFIVTNSGKLKPGALYDSQSPSTEPNELKKMLMEEISKVISTYNPG